MSKNIPVQKSLLADMRTVRAFEEERKRGIGKGKDIGRKQKIENNEKDNEIDNSDNLNMSSSNLN